MKKFDVRRLPKAGQQVLRRQVIEARKESMSYPEIQDFYGIPIGTACAWWKRYQAEGEAFFTRDDRGRPKGSGTRLPAEQGERIQALIKGQMPDQLGLPFALWTRHAVQRLIESEYGIFLPIRTVGEYLRRWGYTPQRPAKRAYEQNPKAMHRWLDEDYPAIAKRTHDEGAEIHWGDETGLRSDHQAGRSYSQAGETPVARIPARRVRVPLISTVTNRGKLRFMHFTGAMNSTLLIQFFKRLIKDSDRKVFLILDNLRVHHSKQVKKWVAAHDDEIELFYLPPYSPERNPDEYLNGDLKKSVHGQMPARTEAELRRKTMSRLRSIQKRPAHVRSYFKNRFIQYAA